MPFYLVMLRGYNFPGHALGKPKERFGFYTTRWVQALNSKRAELKADEMVWKDPKLVIPNAKGPKDGAWLRLEKVKRVDRLPRFRGGGATWFKD